MTIKLNLNTLLLVLGGMAIAGPDVKAISDWLASLGVSWLIPVSHGFAYAAVACAGLSRALPFVRPFLSKFGLATAPGEAAPVVAPNKPDAG
jgi:hypothetical protein